MTKNDFDGGFDIYSVRNFFDARMCRMLLDELRECPTVSAKIYGQNTSVSVNENIRKSDLLLPSRATVEIITEQLSVYREKIGEHFGLQLNNCEEPQFLRYRVGDFFVAHQDGNTGMLRSEREQRRKISIVFFVNDQNGNPANDGYGGGSLVFSDWHPSRNRGELAVLGEAGKLIAFRSETTHEVIPVTHGERYSIVSWFG
jgi:SM-20-related protein